MTPADHDVAPEVLAQALGSMLGEGEAVACAAFAWRIKGRHLGSPGSGAPILGGGTRKFGETPQLVAVTDRRLIVARADFRTEGEGEYAMNDWQSGRPVARGTISRRELWLGQIASVTHGSPRDPGYRITMTTTDGRLETLCADPDDARVIRAALGAGLDGPHRVALPPPAPQTGSWPQRIAAILRRNRGPRA